MAYTVSFLDGSKDKSTWGNKKSRIAEVTLTGSYVIGGEPLTPQDFGMRDILFIQGFVTEAAGQTATWFAYWDRVNRKMKLFGTVATAAQTTGQTEHTAIAYAASTIGHIMLIGT